MCNLASAFTSDLVSLSDVWDMMDMMRTNDCSVSCGCAESDS